MAHGLTVRLAQDVVSIVHGTVKKVDKSTKTIVVKAADGTEKAFEYTDNAAKDVGKETGKGIDQGSKVSVYYTEEAGKNSLISLSDE